MLGTVFIVSVLCIVRIILIPDTWATSLVALVFLPVSISLITIRSRNAGEDRVNKISGKLRAGLVGAGVLLATSLLLSITDRLGFTQESASGGERSLIVILPAVIATAADLLSARLESKAEKDPD